MCDIFMKYKYELRDKWGLASGGWRRYATFLADRSGDLAQWGGCNGLLGRMTVLLLLFGRLYSLTTHCVHFRAIQALNKSCCHLLYFLFTPQVKD